MSRPEIKNIPLFKNPKSVAYAFPFRSVQRGRIARSSRHVGLECDGRSHATRFFVDDGWAAYGEVVWSWRRDPGATSAVSPVGNGGKKGRSPGRARISRKAIAWGKPECLGCTCQTRVRCFLFAHGAAGAVGARPSLRPLFGEGQRDRKTRTNHVARMSTYVHGIASCRRVGKAQRAHLQKHGRKGGHGAYAPLPTLRQR